MGLTNRYEMAGRVRKAYAIATALHRAGIKADKAKLMSDVEWIEVAHQAECKPPSDETIRMVLEAMAEMETAGLDKVA